MLSLKNLADETRPVLAYIDATWQRLRANARHGHMDRFSDWAELAASSSDGHLDDIDPANPYILFLPNDFITPGGRFMVQFYWDSYFVMDPLLRGGHFELAKGMVENCLFLVERHGMVIANRKRWASGSQLPFLSQMVRSVYTVSGDKAWLAWAAAIVENEYANHWLNEDHLVRGGLSRYHAPSCYPLENIADITMDHEASWDLSPRFDREDVLHLLPVDLNCNLYTYEKDFAFFCDQAGQREAATRWTERAETRAEQINELMWDAEDGLYYDYDFVRAERKKIRSLVTFFPMFHRIASEERAERISAGIRLFEHEYGLATCDQTYGYVDRQWNYPVGWAPLHLIVFSGLRHYGANAEAQRIALKWLGLNLEVWKRTGKLFEKYDVVLGSSEVLEDRYKNQEGFAWTNGVFCSLVTELLDR
jgi:alpha,alpha-trehalase